MIYVPDYLRPHICVDYPQSNRLIFEEWLTQQTLPQLEREFIPIHVTSYHVNNNYGQDREAIYKLQEFFDGLDRSKKYWGVWQYDDGLLIDTKDLDIVTFGMSYRLPEQKPTYFIPLIGQMMERGYGLKKFKANFIGNITHPIRQEVVDTCIGVDGYYISTQQTEHSLYNKVMSESMWTLCPIGYGKCSFRFFEAIHNNSIPVAIGDCIEPYGIDINEYAVKITEEQVQLIPEILSSFTNYEFEKKKKRLGELYPILCTYEGVLGKIIETLNNEG